MKLGYSTAFLAICLLASGCERPSDKRQVYTLYRNSPYSSTMRLHIATFDSDDLDTSGESANKYSCNFVSRIWNSNIVILNKKSGTDYQQTYGFWCEKGSFRNEGPVPSHFIARFPIRDDE